MVRKTEREREKEIRNESKNSKSMFFIFRIFIQSLEIKVITGFMTIITF